MTDATPPVDPTRYDPEKFEAERVRRLAAVQRRFVGAAEKWQEHARIEHEIAKACKASEAFDKMNGGGYTVRAQYRAAKNAAKAAEEHAMRCFEIAQNGSTSTRRRGPGKKPKVVEPPKVIDPATAHLLKRAAEKKAQHVEAGKKGGAAVAAKRAAEAGELPVEESIEATREETCEACGSTMFATDVEKHAEVCVG